VNANREAALFTYSGIATNDASMISKAAEFIASGKSMKELIASGAKPDLMKRGTVRSAFDGRYKFTRYLSPLQRNRPGNSDELYAFNDVELFDLESDPNELNNLAATKGENKELVEEMSGKLERVIASEMRADDGREMPDLQGQKISWALPPNAID
jgi:arylsulfatase